MLTGGTSPADDFVLGFLDFLRCLLGVCLAMFLILCAQMTDMGIKDLADPVSCGEALRNRGILVGSSSHGLQVVVDEELPRLAVEVERLPPPDEVDVEVLGSEVNTVEGVVLLDLLLGERGELGRYRLDVLVLQ